MRQVLQKKIKKLPTTPGVYLFYNAQKKLIYVGKATNLRSRVRSYFQASQRSPKASLLGSRASTETKGAEPSYFRGEKTSRPIERMIEQVMRIDFRQTDSVLEALILEANLIKKHQPKYNVDGKDDKSWQYICISNDTYPQIVLMRQHEFAKVNKKEFAKIFGPYTSGTSLKHALKIFRRIFLYSTCNAQDVRPCLYYEMGQCLGVCVGEITAAEYKKKVITPLSMFLQGRKKVLLVKIQKQMKEASRAHKYEEASRLRDQLKALQHIQDIALLNKEFVEDTVGFLEKIRIEGYDIAHISGTSMVGSMVVLNANGPQKAHYRKFKIKTVEGANDTAALQEVLERRLGHPEWPYPDVFLIDGGTAQVNAVYKVLQKNTINIPIVGIAKGPSRKNNKFSHKPNTKSFGNWVAKHKNLLIQARDEAHRFAQSYHKKLRGKKLLS